MPYTQYYLYFLHSYCHHLDTSANMLLTPFSSPCYLETSIILHSSCYKNTCWHSLHIFLHNISPIVLFAQESQSIGFHAWPIKSLCTKAASYPGHVGGRKSGLVSTVCTCAKTTMISWGIVYHRLRTVNFYHIAPKCVCPELIPRTAGER